MAEPVSPDTGGRSLADILREAGIENPSRSGRRRRWDDMDDTGIRQRGDDGTRDGRAGAAPYGRRAGDLPLDRPEVDRSSGMPRVRDDRFRRPQPADVRDGNARAADERPRDERPRDGRARGDRARGEEPPRDERSRRDAARAPARDAVRDSPREAVPETSRDPLRDTGRRPARPEPPQGDRSGGPSTAAIPGLRPSRTPSVPGAAAPAPAGAAATAAESPARERRRDKRGAGGHRAEDAGPSTGRIPPVDASDADLDPAPSEGALAWLRFAGELVIAAAVGVGVYFAFTVLWEMVPHLAALASPLVVTGLVLGVSAWRQRTGHGQLGPRLLGALVFAGTVLSILPAAGLLSG